MNVNKYGGLKKRARVSRVVISCALIYSWRAREKAFAVVVVVLVFATNFAYQMESAHRCTGLLFITARISHLATERSVARSRRIETSLVNTKTVLFHHRTASIFYISVFKAVQPFTFKVAPTTTRLYASIPRSVTFLICRTWARAPGRARASFTETYVVAFVLFNWMIVHLHSSLHRVDTF